MLACVCAGTFSPRVSEHGVSHHHDGPSQHMSQHKHMEFLQTLIDRVLWIIHTAEHKGAQKYCYSLYHIILIKFI